MAFLQLLSSKAQQNITFHCRNTIAYYDNQKHTYRKGLKLMTWNDAELTPRGNSKLRYEVIEDDCKVNILRDNFLFAKILSLYFFSIDWISGHKRK